MAKKLYGLVSVMIGPIAADGGMGTNLTEVFGATSKGTASLEFSEPSTQDIEIEETDIAYDTIITTPGKWSLKMDTFNVGAASLKAACGGTITGTGNDQVWDAPDLIDYQEQSAQLTTRSGAIIQIPRLKYMGIPKLKTAKDGFGTISLTGTPLVPTKVGVKSIRFADTAAALAAANAGSGS